MSGLERLPELSDEVATLAWEAAQAANVAFDELTKVDTRIAALDSAERNVADLHLPGVELVVADETRVTLSTVREKHDAKFKQLQKIAGVAMNQPLAGNFLKSPWSTEPSVKVEAVEIPEIDTETAEKLENLSPEYRQLVTTRYAEAYRAVDGYIREGKLPESYRLPELSALVDRVFAVAPAFEALHAQANWQPSVEFVPEGLTNAEWNDLFATHKLPNGQQMNGTYRTIPEGTIDTIGRDQEDQSLWDVAVISAADRPIYTNVSKDGKNGSNAKEAVAVFEALPWVTAKAKKPEEVIAQVSPREAVYNRLQLARLERGEQPVDPETWTISQENVKVDVQVRSVMQNFDPNSRQVRSRWNRLDYAYDDVGVRPSASGSDLIFRSSASA